MSDFTNRLFVQLFKIPWIKRRWASSFVVRQEEQKSFRRLGKPLNQCRVALLTTGGPHLKSDPPFDMEDPQGDGSCRSFPLDVDWNDLTITHKYYDSKSAERDLGVLIPIRPLQNAVASGKIGAAGPRVFSLMGHLIDEQLEHLYQVTLPRLVQGLKDDQVDCLFLAPA
ncbi:MAG: hypothetical protein RRB13_15565 [bacterium]|nr:hypothetical protein [bacterium]